ncbi:MAG: response regulator [Candidatus Viridilinea halotolerans]|uniref:Response regulator n=1 Tax=Candidatus Viridilinea halotolerans TaxID=2491704 RepID=A0A426TVQ3_9CHLR|nr:MAG: response regulator [Candidatus Viridilinea halotolerans]
MKKILVVDDNFDNRNIIAQMLRLSGFLVVVAGDGYQAIEMTEREIPDLILMDLSMPRMDGWSATARIKERPELAHVPVIAVTGHATRDDIERALSAGCRDYLIKPIDMDAMLHKVQGAL